MVVAVALASPADACCAGDPSDSPGAFVGTVIDTTFNGRVATVRTGEDEEVEVWGTPATEAGSFSTVDRRYRIGATYEFHPTNGEDPYQDNACTATHRLRGEDIPTSLRDGFAEDGDAEEATVADASPPAVPSGRFPLGAAFALPALGLGGALLWLRLGRR